MSDVHEIDAITGETVERDYTAEELAQSDLDAKAEADRAKAAAEAEKARDAAIAHAKSLGFTDAMIAVMYPNLVTS